MKLIDSADLGLEDSIALELPQLSREAVKELQGHGVRARRDKENGRWVVPKSRYRAVWRFLQHWFPGEDVEGPTGTFTVDPTPGVASSMGLDLPRPAWMKSPDERFWTLKEAHGACNAYFEQSGEKEVSFDDLRVEAQKDGGISLVGKQGVPARLTHWAFSQLADRAQFPAGPLRTLPATLAAQVLNHKLKARAAKEPGVSGNLLFQMNGGLILRAMLSQRYERIWNHEVFDRLIGLEAKGWRVPPARPSPKEDPRARPATEADILENSQRNLKGLAIEVGDLIAPAGIYASDHDMFAFMVNEDRLIDDGKGNFLARGAFAWNSEVGAKSIGMMTFLYYGICGNHIVWNAQGVREVRIRHSKSGPKKFKEMELQLREYVDGEGSEDEAKIKAARSFTLGKEKDEVLDAIFGIARKERIDVSRKALGDGYDVAEKRVDDYGSPNSLWGMVNGLTQLSQETTFAENRARLDRAAGKLMEVIF
jgi:hypothetical protein